MMRMMATGGRILEDDTFKQTVRMWKENGEDDEEVQLQAAI